MNPNPMIEEQQMVESELKLRHARTVHLLKQLYWLPAPILHALDADYEQQLSDVRASYAEEARACRVHPKSTEAGVWPTVPLNVPDVAPPACNVIGLITDFCVLRFDGLSYFYQDQATHTEEVLSGEREVSFAKEQLELVRTA